MIVKSDITWYEMSDSAILEVLGTFLKEIRLRQNRTQEEVASASGIKRMTLIRIEKGAGGTMSTLIRILRSLEQLHVLKSFEIPQQISPLQLAKLEQNKRLRATKKKPKAPNKKSDW